MPSWKVKNVVSVVESIGAADAIADNYEDFVLTNIGIEFSFDEGEVGPNAAGALSATVPYFEIEDILISGVVQYRKG